MTSTPNKSLENNLSQSITPVRFLESPRMKQESDSKAAACKACLDLSIKTLDYNFATWQRAQKHGLTICYSIEAIKTRSLEAASKNSSDLEPPTLYPKELKPYCDKLSVIVGMFLDIAENTRKELDQLNALNRMNDVAEKIFYRTWKMQQFIEFAEKISECYEQEAAVKQHVMTHLPHCNARVDLIRCTTAWEYPQHIDASISLLFAFLREEISIDKK